MLIRCVVTYGPIAVWCGCLWMFLVISCQRILCARRYVLYAFGFAAVLSKLGLRFLPRYRNATGVENLGGSVSGLLECWSPSREKNALCLGRWLNGFSLPVLKHGPRSLTCVRVCGWQTCMRNESNRWEFAPSTDLKVLREVWVWAYLLGPERWWTMPE